jgi:hypothetical protein
MGSGGVAGSRAGELFKPLACQPDGSRYNGRFARFPILPEQSSLFRGSVVTSASILRVTEYMVSPVAKNRRSSRNGSKPKPKVEIRNFPINHKPPDAVAQVYANNVLVQSDQSVFNLLFYQVKQPLITDEHTKRSDFKRPDHVDADCVSQILIPAHIMPSLITALGEAFQKNVAAQTAIQAALSNAESTQKRSR